VPIPLAPLPPAAMPIRAGDASGAPGTRATLARVPGDTACYRVPAAARPGPWGLAQETLNA